MLVSCPSLQSLKCQAYAIYGVSSTKALKKLVGGSYDFRRRATWLALVGSSKRSAYTGKAICAADIWFIGGKRTANNIVQFELPLSALARQVDEILGKSLYD